MVLEAVVMDEKDEEIFRLQQLLYAAEDQIERLEKSATKPKKYRMTKAELSEWRELERLADRVEANKCDFFYCDGISQKQAEKIRDEIVDLFILGMDLLEIAEYGENPRSPASDDRYANCFADFEAKAHYVFEWYTKAKPMKKWWSEWFGDEKDEVQALIGQFEKLKHWKP